VEKSVDGPSETKRMSGDEVSEIRERQAWMNSISPEAAVEIR
jgi:hypothetical protein